MSLKRIADEVTSLSYYLRTTLPHAERNLNNIRVKLESGEEPRERDLISAMCSSSFADTALERYPNSREVTEYAERIQTLYDQILNHFPSCRDRNRNV